MLSKTSLTCDVCHQGFIKAILILGLCPITMNSRVGAHVTVTPPRFEHKCQGCSGKDTGSWQLPSATREHVSWHKRQQQTLLVQSTWGYREVKQWHSEMQGWHPASKQQEKEACFWVILQQQSVKVRCEPIMLLVTGLLNSKQCREEQSKSSWLGDEPHALWCLPSRARLTLDPGLVNIKWLVLKRQVPGEYMLPLRPQQHLPTTTAQLTSTLLSKVCMRTKKAPWGK